MQALQHTAYDVIDFIAQFEDELRRAWEKPKFVRGVHYVVTLDKLPDELLKRITRHEGIKAQMKEWQQLGMVEKGFSLSPSPSRRGAGVREKWQHLPLDTKYFKDLELEILDTLGDLDEAMDGELVHSENWQALNTLQKRYKGKVKCIYIDPPYNTDASAIPYKNNYKNSAWLSLMENRLQLSRNILTENGILCVAIDDIEYPNLQILLSKIHGNDSALGTVAVRSNPAGRSTPTGFSSSHEYALFFSKNIGVEIGRLQRTKMQYERYKEKDEAGASNGSIFANMGDSTLTERLALDSFIPCMLAQKFESLT